MMVVEEDTEVGEVVESTMQEQKNHPFSTLGRQSSIFSLTLDEFQHTLCEGGKNFGSMNMDEFLTNIWNAEENQATNTVNHSGANEKVSSHLNGFSLNEIPSSEGVVLKQPGLPRQGSLTFSSLARQASLSLPAPLCRKTVDEVWSEIHRVKQGQGQSSNSNVLNAENSTTRQPTFGEMTLEDFLVKAGVVQEPSVRQAVPQHQQQLGLHQNGNNPAVGSSFVSGPVMGLGGSTYQIMPAAPSQPIAVCYNGKVPAGGGYGPGQAMGVVSPISPVSPEGMCTMEIGGLRGKKRFIDGPVEKVVERRQRRMIKNRESAARSRARKQAYTVELEAELNQLKQENCHLKQALAELETRRKQEYFEEWKMKTQTKAEKATEKLRRMRRTLSCPL